jgi:hypothetical protein
MAMVAAVKDEQTYPNKDTLRCGPSFHLERDLPPFTLFLLIAFCALLPGSLHLGSALLGYPGDTFQHAWFLWHFARALGHGTNPFFTNLIYYPNRVNLMWSTVVPVASILALPTSWLGGPVVAYNVSLLVQLALASLFAYLLCLRICGNLIAAVIGGVCFGFSPWLMGEALGHLSLVTAFPIPLYFLALDNVLRTRDDRWLRGVWLGLALFLSAMAHYNYTVFCGLLTVVILCVDFASAGFALLQRVWKPLLAGAVTFSLFFFPFFISMWGSAADRPKSRNFDLIAQHSADLFGWFVPSWNHILLGHFARSWNLGLFTAGYEGVTYLGPVILLLALIGFWIGRRRQRNWTIRLLTTAITFSALALGPRIRVWGHATAIPGPGLIFYMSPFAKFVSSPARFHVVVMLCLSGLVSLGVAFLLQRLSSHAGRVALIATICVALALDLLTLPFPVVTSAASVRNRGFGIPIDGCAVPADVKWTTVLTVPELQWPYSVRSMWMQLNDGGRYALVDGYVSYGADALWQKYWSELLLRSVRSVQAGDASPVTPAVLRASLPATLHDLNLGAVVVFDFPQREATVSFLQAVLNQSGQRQEHCTVFDLQNSASAANAPVQPAAPDAGSSPNKAFQ